jgi:uncharacterized protein (TIGR02453 family)
MKNEAIPKSTFDFLSVLAKNNNREWFLENKDAYLRELQNMILFADNLLSKMRTHDTIETNSGKESLYRIFKDIRFSKDKTPYRTNWSGGFRRATKEKRGGYIFHLEMGNSYLAGGFFNPNAQDLKRIRQDIDTNHLEWQTLLNSSSIGSTFGQLSGSQLKTSPKGFSKDHPAIDLLCHKQFILKHTFTDQEVLSVDFTALVNETFKKLRPFFDHMSEILTTDANGISTV